jgi:hypothetical protein
MKSVAILLLIVIVAVSAADPVKPAAAAAGAGASSPLPATLPGPLPDLSATPYLLSNSKCAVRPQTLEKINVMRAGASKMAALVKNEVALAAKRKAYVEQMTKYINDRIKELNKVKRELEEEVRWVEMTNNRIAAVAEEEKVVRFDDVMACIKREKSMITDENKQHDTTLAALMKDHEAAQKNLKDLKSKITAAEAGGATQGSTVASDSKPAPAPPVVP